MSAPRPGDLLGARYVLLDVLGEGSFSIVFRARDRWRQEDVAVKVFRGGDPEERTLAARREHLVARDLRHPAIASATDAGRFSGHPFVVLELAAGEALDVAMRDAEPRQILRVIDTLAAGLAVLHARDLVHGDLKPANVRVARRGQRLEARLVDLGCARPPGTVGGGTAAYAAPEALGGAATVASDLFSLGVIAWELLTGALPFGSPDEEGYLSRLAGGQPGREGDHLAPELAAILRRLLSSAPTARYGSAGELRAALGTVLEAGAAEQTPPSPELVERDGALAAIRVFTKDVARGPVGPQWIVGTPRSGRSRVLSLAAAEARIDGFGTLETSARDGLVAWLHDLVRQAERAGASGADAARAAIDDRAGGAEGRHARLFAVLDVLTSAATGAPLLVLVDDADEASPAVREALRFLAASRGEARVGWVIVDRAGEGGVEVRLDALSEAGASALISSLLPGIDGALELARLARARSDATPGSLVEGTLALVDARAIRFVDGQWRRAAEGVPDWAYQDLDEARIDARLEQLGREARTTLCAIALDGGTVEAASARLGLASDLVARAAGPALRAGLLRAAGAGLTFASSEVRAQLVSRLGPEAREALHHDALARLANQVDPGSRAARTRHLAALGRRAEAASDALEAGRAAADAGDLHDATALLEQARVWGEPSSAGPAALALATIHASLGQVDSALAALDHALTSGLPAAVVARARGGVLARAARYDEAIAALGAVGDRGSLEPIDRFWLGWSLMMRGRYDEAEPLAARADCSEAERARLGRLAGTIAWHRGHFDEACAILEAAGKDARASADKLLVAEVEQSMGTAERLRGRLDEAASHYAAAIAASRAAGFVAVLAKSLNNLAIVEYQSGRWEGARHAWESMRELAVRLSAHEEILLAHNNLGLLFQDRGELARAERSLDEAIRLARLHELARYEAMATGNRAEVRARAGRWDAATSDLDAAEAIADRIGARDETLECRRRRAMVRLGRGDAGGALLDALAAAVEAAESGARAESGHAYLIAAASARTLGRVDEAERHLGSVASAWASGTTRLDAARLDLERANVRLAAGDRREAVRIARRAGAVFAELGAERELALVRTLEDADVSVDRGEALLEILKVAGEAAGTGALLDTVLGRIVHLTGAERGVVITFSGDEEPRIAARRGGEGQDPIVSRGIADRAIASRRALVLANVDDESDLAGRDSVMRLGVRAALCAPLMQGDACLGLLYVDSTRGPELVRFGVWVVDAAAAILAPALARLAEREHAQEREALLRAAAIDGLETVGALDSAFDLIADGVTREGDAARVGVARERCTALLARSGRLLELVRVDAQTPSALPEEFSVRTLIASALEALEGSATPSLELDGCSSLVTGVLDRLASAVTRMIESATRARGGPTTLRVREVDPLEDGSRPRERGWRPGASAGRRFVRIEVEGGALDPFGADETALAMRAARRLAAQSGGRLFAEPVADGHRIVMEIEAMEGTT